MKWNRRELDGKENRKRWRKRAKEREKERERKVTMRSLYATHIGRARRAGGWKAGSKVAESKGS